LSKNSDINFYTTS